MIIPEGCKPFDLERALAGDPVVTREGRTVTQLVKFDVGGAIDVVYGVFDGHISSWSVNGRYWSDCESKHDIFMAPKKRTVWVNLYGDGLCYRYDSKAEADEASASNRIGNRAYPVEIEG
jgi:hypothetical protein